jgi:hypothetical protein
MDNIKEILGQYLSERIPRKVTNILWEIFNGIEASFNSLEYRLNIFKRERNILVAQQLSSLRSLAAQNGFQPVLKIPAKGIIYIKVNPKLFARVGYPLFIPAYSLFTNKNNKLTYYYSDNKPFKISNSDSLFIPLVEGTVKSVTQTASSEYIQRFYLADNNIADGSISILINGDTEFVEVKSFFDNENLNSNKQFLTKFGINSLKPIAIYIKGLNDKDSIVISYRLTEGELGNIVGLNEFETEAIIDSNGETISIEDDEIQIVNYNGFNLGSNGTDENALRAAIGYNHGKTLLFDNLSYAEFIGKYSTILLQSISNPEKQKTINNIYVSRKQAIQNNSLNIDNYINQYKTIISNKLYLLNVSEKLMLSKVLEEYEYALTSHNIYDANVNKFAFQIIMESQQDIENYGDQIKEILYSNFAKFLYSKNHIFNIENIFDTYQSINKINFEYIIFNEKIESNKILNRVDSSTPYVITHSNYLPILCGDFPICDSNFISYKLFTDINIVLK